MSPDSTAAAQHGSPGGSHGGVHRHPAFPNMPSSVALTYTLLVKACLSATAADRPTFRQILQILLDVEREVASGTYIDSLGVPQPSSALQGMPCNHQEPADRHSAAAPRSARAVESRAAARDTPAPAAAGTAGPQNAPVRLPVAEFSDSEQGSSLPVSEAPAAGAAAPAGELLVAPSRQDTAQGTKQDAARGTTQDAARDAAQADTTYLSLIHI